MIIYTSIIEVNNQVYKIMNYQAEITVPVTRKIAYTAIAEDMSIWWTEMSARFLKIGDKAKTDFGGKSYWVFEAITLDEHKLVELRCCEANHIHEGMSSDIKEEWLDTVLSFAIEPAHEGTSITLTHNGLNRDLLCYDICQAGWDHYFCQELKTYLTNKGKQS